MEPSVLLYRDKHNCLICLYTISGKVIETKAFNKKLIKRNKKVNNVVLVFYLLLCTPFSNVSIVDFKVIVC